MTLIGLAGIAMTSWAVAMQPSAPASDPPAKNDSGATGVSARTDGQPESGPGSASKDGESDERERRLMRERLERRMEFMRKNAERLQKAIDLLDKGASLDEVREMGDEFMRPPFGGGRMRGGEGGRGRPPGPPGGPGDRPPPPEGRPDGPWRGPDDGGPPPGGPRPDGPPDPRMFMEFIKHRAPKLFQRMRDIEEQDPQAVPRMLNRFRMRVRELLDESDPALVEARAQELMIGFDALGKARQLRMAIDRGSEDSDDAKKLTTELREIFGRAFDARRKIHEGEIETLKKRVDLLSRELDERAGAREQFVDERVTEILDGIRHRRRPDGSDGPEGDRPPPPPPPR